MHRVVIVSDLHLSVGPKYPVEIFYADAPFSAFLGDPLLSPDAGGSVDLVLLGDSFDFWQTVLHDADYTAASSSEIPLEYTAQEELSRFMRVQKAHPQFFAGLKQFLTNANRKLTFVFGNHDHSLVDSKCVQQAIRELVGGNVEFATHFDSPDIGLYAEHGNQSDIDNCYAAFEKSGLDGESHGYFFVRLFWNRAETAEPRLIELFPPNWRSVWHDLMPILRENPSALARALRFWVQYSRDPRVPAHVHVLFAAAPGQPGAADVPEQATPDLLAATEVSDGNVFSDDAELENALREAYHSQPLVKEAVDELRPDGSAAVPPPERAMMSRHPVYAARAPELEGKQGAEALFESTPTALTDPLDANVYRYVVFGHTHAPGRVKLSNGVWYLNSGSWTGRPPAKMSVIVGESGGPQPRVALGEFTNSRIQIKDADWC